MKRSNIKSRLKLDYTTALIVSVVCLALVSLAVLSVSLIEKKINEQNDHKKPLEITNLSYCNGEKLDLFVPQNLKPLPLVIYIHGGGWQYGSKVGGSVELIKPLVDNNIAVASINYRLSNSAKFPSQINDVFCAVRYLRKNAELLNIDASKIGLIGISAGAHLAALAGNAADQTAFTAGAFQDQSSAVQAVVGINGIYSLESKGLQEDTTENASKLLSGSKFTKSAASPSTYVTKDDPPHLLIYGLKDKQVLPSQSEEYLALAQSKGMTIDSLAVERAGHNLQPYFALTINPNKENITQIISNYFQKQLEI